MPDADKGDPGASPERRCANPHEASFLLASWLSPAYPVGAYTYSHGLETAIADGQVCNAEECKSWIAACLSHGAGRNDAILLAHAWRACQGDGNAPALNELAELARALAPSAERLLETEAMGAAFGDVTSAAWIKGEAGNAPEVHSALPYPVAVGSAAARRGAALDQAVVLFLQAFAANLISAAVRLVPLGQTDGQRVLAALMELCLEVAAEAKIAELGDIGGCAILSDISAMRHETQQVRLFRS